MASRGCKRVVLRDGDEAGVLQDLTFTTRSVARVDSNGKAIVQGVTEVIEGWRMCGGMVWYGGLPTLSSPAAVAAAANRARMRKASEVTAAECCSATRRGK